MFDKQSCSVIIILLSLVLMLACSQSGKAEGPGGAVQLFYQQLNDGNYNSAKEMYSAEARATLDDPELSSAGGFRTWAETQTKNRSISNVNILQELGDDGGATIDFEITYRDGTTKTSQVRLTEEDGEWKLGFSLDLSL
jgi:hypothetical protein